MNVLFLSLSSLVFGKGHGIYQDLIEELQKNGHKVYAVSPRERRQHLPTELVETNGIQVLYVKCGNMQKCSFIEKGISNITIEHHYYKAIKKYYKSISFDLILYPTPPIFLIKPIRFVKKRDHAKAYLMLKDIFPQNALDLGIMTNCGPMGLMYRMFRAKEKKLYAISDRIGCMSPANVQYLLTHNPQIPSEKVGICVNSFAKLLTLTVGPPRLREGKKQWLRIQIFIKRSRFNQNNYPTGHSNHPVSPAQYRRRNEMSVRKNKSFHLPDKSLPGQNQRALPIAG